MLIFGHPFIKNEKLYHISSLEAIEHTPSNSTVLLTYNADIFEFIEKATQDRVDFAIDITSLKDAIICENLNAKYILVPHEIAKSVQKAADTYIFDAKILVHAKDENSIEELAEEGIDGIIFSEAIIKIS